MTAATREDLRWLDAAVRFATPQLGTTAENPTAAALVVEARSQTLLSRAVTGRGGRPHAEAQALEQAGFEAAGCTLYVTMEPCGHWGRTPPCADAIIRAGIMRVVIGAADPDPRGSSARHLESAGVEVVFANHAASEALHAGHILRQRAYRPRVTAFLAVAADDGIVDPTGLTAHWLDVQRTRVDAVLIGAARARDMVGPLAVDLPGLASRTPLRLVLSGAAGVDRRLNLIGGFSGHRTAIIAENDVAIDAPISVEVLRVPGDKGHVDLAAALTALAQKGIQNLLVEPGPRLTEALLEADLIDSFAVVTTPQISGGVPASSAGPIAALLDAAGLVAGEPTALGDASLTLYRRPA